MKLSINVPDEVVRALEEAMKRDPTSPSRSKVVSEALVEYLRLHHPDLLQPRKVIGPRVLAFLKAPRKRGPSLMRRRTGLNLPRWVVVES